MTISAYMKQHTLLIYECIWRTYQFLYLEEIVNQQTIVAFNNETLIRRLHKTTVFHYAG